ncbi:hypothetical protein ABPG73_019540 [Tetrahymena malaccensis]
MIPQFVFKYTLEDKFDKNKIQVESNFELKLDDIIFDCSQYAENYKWDLIATIKEQVIQQKMNLGFFYFYILYNGGFLEYQPPENNRTKQQTPFIFQYDNKSYCGYSTASSYQDNFQLLLKQSLQQKQDKVNFNKILMDSYFYSCKKMAFELDQYPLCERIKNYKWQACNEKIRRKLNLEQEYFEQNKFKLEHETYSAQIFFDSIYQLIYDKKQFEMKFQVPISQFNQDLNKNLLKITFIGCHNKGKTFIINFLEKKNFASSFDSITEGQAYYIGKSFIYLDQAGYDRAVDLSKNYYSEAKKNNRNIKDFLIDKNKIDEIFILISLKFCNVCIVCCDVLTQSDQQLIYVVKKHIKAINDQGQQQKRLIVLHNLKNIQSLYEILQNIYQNIGLAFYRKKKIYNFKISDQVETIPNSFIFEQLNLYLLNYYNPNKIFKYCPLFIVKYFNKHMKQEDRSKFYTAYQTWKENEQATELDKELLSIFNINENDYIKKFKKFKQFQEKLSLFILLEFFQPIEDGDILHFTSCDIKSQYSFQIFQQIRKNIYDLQAIANQSTIQTEFTEWIRAELEKELKKIIKQGKQEKLTLTSEQEGNNKLIFKIKDQNNQDLDIQNNIDIQRDVFSLDEQYQPSLWKESEGLYQDKLKITLIVETVGINNLKITRQDNQFWMAGEKTKSEEDGLSITQSNAKYGNFKINISKKYGQNGYYARQYKEIEQRQFIDKGIKQFEFIFQKV